MSYRVCCQKCAHEFDAESWHPGLQCPKCKAVDTAPVTRVQTAPAESGQEQMTGAGMRGTWKTSPVVAVIAVVVILACAVGLVMWKWGPPAQYRAGIYATCTQCGEVFEAVWGDLPETCPKCGADACVYAALQCNNKECGHVFAFVPAEALEEPNYAAMENISDKERAELKDAYRLKEDEYMKKDEAARQCPKCKSGDTTIKYTEEQKKRFQESARGDATSR